MRPVLFSILGLDIQTYGVSKALAALAGAYLLGRAFERLGPGEWTGGVALLYEALAAVVIAAILWALGKRWNPPAVFGAYLGLSGIARFLVETVRTNDPALFGLTQPQLWSLLSVVAGAILIAHTRPLRPQDPVGAAADDRHALAPSA